MLVERERDALKTRLSAVVLTVLLVHDKPKIKYYYYYNFHHNRRYVSGVSAVPLQACRAHLFKEAGGPRSNNRMDQNEGVLCHTADCPSLFEGNKVTEKKDKFTRE